MQFAPVCPIHIYEQLALKGSEYIGDYFLLLAHDVLENKERYNKFFTSPAIIGATIILDNSVIELGSACNGENLIEAAKIVNADVVVIPDVLENGYETLRMANSFIPQWGDLCAEANTHYDLMFVPQGRDAEDYMRCFEGAVNAHASKIEWVGVARNLVGRVFPTRRIPVGYIEAYINSMEMHSTKIHMLGYSNDLEDDMLTCRQFKDIVWGIDSAVPLRGDNKPRGQWWNEAVFDNDMADRLLAVRKALGELR